MTKQDARELITRVGIVPVIRAASAEQALHAVEAIQAGGIPIVEITMTVPGAVGVIRELSKRIADQVLVGAGTVLNAAVARECVEAGARFLVSPGLCLPVIELARSQGTLVMAGALTPTEIVTAWEAGADFVKVFPCGQVGGPSYIRAVRAPLPQVALVPTGGVTLENAADFILAGASALGIGGDLVDLDSLENGQMKAITQRAAQFVQAVRMARDSCQHLHLAEIESDR